MASSQRGGGKSTPITNFQSIVMGPRAKNPHPGEMKEIREKEALEKETTREQQKNNIKKVAQIEEELRREESERRTSNCSMVAPFQPNIYASAKSAEVLEPQGDCWDICKQLTIIDDIETIVIDKNSAREPYNDSGSEGSQDEYRPPAYKVSQSEPSESEAAEDRDEEDGAPKRNKQQKIWETYKESKEQPGWDSAYKTLSNARNEMASPVDNDNSMVRYGGMVGDSEEDDLECIAAVISASGKSSKKKALPAMIKISAATSAPGPVTKKALRGGANKWNLNHLPGPERQVVQKTFTQVVVPLAKAMAGTMVPWSELSVVHVQSLIDKAFGENLHVVQRDDVWCGLISYRLNSWQNGFGTTAATAVRSYIQENEENFENNAMTLEASVAQYIELFTTVSGDPPTAPFHWHEYELDEETGTPKKRGHFQHPLIMYTLAHGHFADFDDVPNPETLDKSELPSGALILALQAVYHTFGSWTGKYIKDASPKGFFSADIYGDGDEHAGSLPSFFAFLAATSLYVASYTDYLRFYCIDKSLAIRSSPLLSQKLPKCLGYISLSIELSLVIVSLVICLRFIAFYCESPIQRLYFVTSSLRRPFVTASPLRHCVAPSSLRLPFITASPLRSFVALSREADGNGKMKAVHVNTTSQYLPTLKALTMDYWVKIFNDVRKILEQGKKRKRSKSISSRASSDAYDEVETHEYILLSDD
ncbi:hypothetical protein BYT27DRAFT_7258471 [Phlegmacium glaucopus]|nr:hypothetical protein BYT27DRAFT_7258471 [Phlegmacium glaucopus]